MWHDPQPHGLEAGGWDLTAGGDDLEALLDESGDWATARPCINVGEVIHEIIDGEVVIIHLGTGSYYSLAGVGAEVWSAIAEEAPAAEIVERVASGWDGAQDVIAADIRRLLADLAREHLLTTRNGSAGPTTGRPPRRVPAADGDRRPYAAPNLEIFTDMQDLILLDPIHEVGDQGWPHALGSGSDAGT